MNNKKLYNIHYKDLKNIIDYKIIKKISYMIIKIEYIK